MSVIALLFWDVCVYETCVYAKHELSIFYNLYFPSIQVGSVYTFQTKDDINCSIVEKVSDSIKAI